MIDHLTSYHLRDFLLFSKETLLAINEQYNIYIWPLQIPALTFGAMLLFWVFRPIKYSAKISYLFLSFSLIFIAYAYHLKIFSEINWASKYIALALVLESLILIVFVYKSKFISGPKWFGLSVLALSFIPFDFQNYKTNLLIGWGTEATLLAIIATAILYNRKRDWSFIMPIPIILCALSFATRIYLK